LSGAPSVQVAPNQPGVQPDPSHPGSYDVPINDQGEAILSFYDTSLDSGTVSACALDSQGNPASNTDSTPFNFGQARHGVSEADIQYEGGTYGSAWIYANGLQQAKTLTLVDKNNTALTAMPDIEDVYGAVKLLDFKTGVPLHNSDDPNDTTSSVWSYSRKKDEDDWLPETSEPGSGQARHKVAAGDNGTITLTYYVTCTQGGSDVKFGLAIIPTGGQVLDTGQTDQATGVHIGQYETPSPPQYFNQDFDPDFSLTVTLSAKTPLTFDDNSLSTTPKLIHGGNDNGPVGGGIDTDDNYWRLWDYTLGFSSKMQALDGTQLKLTKAVLADAPDYWTDFGGFACRISPCSSGQSCSSEGGTMSCSRS
jgi:hypothetical protein